jgi:hypothetical protein
MIPNKIRISRALTNKFEEVVKLHRMAKRCCGSKQKKLETGFVMLLFRIGPLVAPPARGGLVIDVFRLKIERLYLFATLALVEPLVDSE